MGTYGDLKEQILKSDDFSFLEQNLPILFSPEYYDEKNHFYISGFTYLTDSLNYYHQIIFNCLSSNNLNIHTYIEKYIQLIDVALMVRDSRNSESIEYYDISERTIDGEYDDLINSIPQNVLPVVKAQKYKSMLEVCAKNLSDVVYFEGKYYQNGALLAYLKDYASSFLNSSEFLKCYLDIANELNNDNKYSDSMYIYLKNLDKIFASFDINLERSIKGQSQGQTLILSNGSMPSNNMYNSSYQSDEFELPPNQNAAYGSKFLLITILATIIGFGIGIGYMMIMFAK